MFVRYMLKYIANNIDIIFNPSFYMNLENPNDWMSKVLEGIRDQIIENTHKCGGK